MAKLFGGRFAFAARSLTMGSGRSVTLTRHTQTGARTPANPTGSVSNVSVSGTAPVISYDQDEIDGTKIQEQDQKVMLSPIDFGATEPDTSDTITIDGVVRQIVSVKVVKPADTGALYVVQVRGS